MLAPLRRIWDALDDPVILAACVPGNDSLIQSATHTFIAKGRIKLGVVSARITVDIHIEPIDPPRYATIVLDAHSAMGKADAIIQLTLKECANRTRLDYAESIKFSGRAGRLAGRLSEDAAKDLVRSFFERLARAIPPDEISTDAHDTHITDATTEPVKPPRRTLPWTEPPRWKKNAAWIGSGAAAALIAAAAIVWNRRRR